MLFASALGVAVSHTMSGAPCPCSGNPLRKPSAAILRRTIEYGFILYRYSLNLILVKYLGTNIQFAPLTSELTCYAGASNKKHMKITRIRSSHAYQQNPKPIEQ